MSKDENKLRTVPVGGQAVLEGVMMRGPRKIAVAVRKANGEIEVKVEDNVPLYKRHKVLGLPIIRGMAAFVDSLIVGVRTLSYSAEFFEEEETKLEKYMKDKLKGRYKDFEMGLSLLISIIFAALLFFVLPTFAAGLIKSSNRVYTNIFEGIIRLLVFLGYIGLISKLKDIQRVFQYHGAEHKSIYCYETYSIDHFYLFNDVYKPFKLVHHYSRNTHKKYPSKNKPYLLIIVYLVQLLKTQNQVRN